MIEDLISEFESENEVYEKKYVSSNLNKKLNMELREFDFVPANIEESNDYSVKCFKNYFFNTNSYDKKTHEFRFYEEKPINLSLQELETVISFQNSKNIKKIEKNVGYISIFTKVCMVIIIINVIIILTLLLFIISKYM